MGKLNYSPVTGSNSHVFIDVNNREDTNQPLYPLELVALKTDVATIRKYLAQVAGPGRCREQQPFFTKERFRLVIVDKNPTTAKSSAREIYRVYLDYTEKHSVGKDTDGEVIDVWTKVPDFTDDCFIVSNISAIEETCSDAVPRFYAKDSATYQKLMDMYYQATKHGLYGSRFKGADMSAYGHQMHLPMFNQFAYFDRSTTEYRVIFEREDWFTIFHKLNLINNGVIDTRIQFTDESDNPKLPFLEKGLDWGLYTVYMTEPQYYVDPHNIDADRVDKIGHVDYDYYTTLHPFNSSILQEGRKIDGQWTMEHPDTVNPDCKDAKGRQKRLVTKTPGCTLNSYLEIIDDQNMCLQGSIVRPHNYRVIGYNAETWSR